MQPVDVSTPSGILGTERMAIVDYEIPAMAQNAGPQRKGAVSSCAAWRGTLVGAVRYSKSKFPTMIAALNVSTLVC
jgi:hypothetical protein